MQSRIVDELASVLGGNVNISPIQGGTINLSFFVFQGKQRYFLKLFDKRSAVLLDRSRLFMQQKALALKGMAPRPIYLSVNSDFQLEEWVEHTNLKQSELNSQQKCLRLANTLNNIHQLSLDLPLLNLASDWRNYISMSVLECSAQQVKEQQKLLSLWQLECEQRSVLCHNDLSFAHVPVNDNGVIFDWEYAATNSPYFDIASCCIINQFNDLERQILVDEYARLAALPLKVVSQKVQNMSAVVNKTYELWGLAFAKIA
jgi:thiamine kinase-like enzyme